MYEYGYFFCLVENTYHTFGWRWRCLLLLHFVTVMMAWGEGGPTPPRTCEPLSSPGRFVSFERGERAGAPSWLADAPLFPLLGGASKSIVLLLHARAAMPLFHEVIVSSPRRRRCFCFPGIRRAQFRTCSTELCR